MPKCAHIYAFVQRSSKVSPDKRLFYVGSSIAIHERVVTHVEALFKAQDLSKPTEVYGYINTHMGEGKFDVFIVDNEVPLGQEKSYERIYYDLMMSQGYQLQNMNKPVPEDNGLLSNFDVMRGATGKLSEFVARVFDSGGNQCGEMTTEELLLNELRKQTIKTCKLEHQDQMKTENDNLKRVNKELRELNRKLKESNEVLQNDLDKTNKMCSLLEELKALKDSQRQVEAQEAIVEVKDGTCNASVGAQSKVQASPCDNAPPLCKYLKFFVDSNQGDDDIIRIAPTEFYDGYTAYLKSLSNRFDDYDHHLIPLGGMKIALSRHIIIKTKKCTNGFRSYLISKQNVEESLKDKGFW